jgi:hypothetical protein
MEFLTGHWAELLLAALTFIKVIVRLTPGVKDDAIFNYIDKVIEFILPNNE